MEVTKTAFPAGDIYYMNEHGKRHREDGPAIIWPNGTKFYYLNGIPYSYEHWLKLVPNHISIKWREFCEVV